MVLVMLKMYNYKQHRTTYFSPQSQIKLLEWLRVSYLTTLRYNWMLLSCYWIAFTYITNKRVDTQGYPLAFNRVCYPALYTRVTAIFNGASSRSESITFSPAGASDVLTSTARVCCAM